VPIGLRYVFCVSCVPLCIGALIYLLWRPDDILVFDLLRGVGLYGNDGALFRFRHTLSPFRSYFPLWAVYSLPLGMWVYASTGFFCHLLRFEGAWVCIGAVTLPASLVVGVEVLQGLSLFRGTFDWVDIFVCMFGALFGLLVSVSNRSYDV